MLPLLDAKVNLLHRCCSCGSPPCTLLGQLQASLPYLACTTRSERTLLQCHTARHWPAKYKLSQHHLCSMPTQRPFPF